VSETFVATWHPAGGVIRVVLVDEPNGWAAFFCTDPTANAADILGAVAGRFSLETAFRDCKDVVGAGQQQVRRVRASVGVFHMCLWTFTMTEAWAWGGARMAWSGTGVRPRGTMTRGGRVTRTSGGRGGGNSWPSKSTRFYGRG
jgi:hypothetical protein